MILDTSAMVAVIQAEPNHEMLLQKMREAETIGVGAPTLVEASLVLGSRLDNAEVLLDAFLDLHTIYIVPFEAAHWREATSAFLRFGKGRHPAKLNFGDCLGYATAKVARKPLLYVGDDFAQTDIARA